MSRLLPCCILLLGSFLLTACGGGGGSGKSVSPPALSSSQPSIPAPASSSSSQQSSATHSEAPAAPELGQLVTFPVGVAVDAGNESRSILREDDTGRQQRQLIGSYFTQITPGNIMKMSYLHPGIDDYYFADADVLVDYANHQGIGVHAHALIWHSDYQVPGWMKDFSGDTQAWVDLLALHVQTIAGHFAGRVASWDVVNEAFLDNGDYRNNQGNEGSLFYQKLGKRYIEDAFINARAADATADLYYNDYNIENGGAKLPAVLAMVDDFQARQIPIDGIGFQMHTHMDWPAIGTIRSAFEQVVSRGLKVKITELDIPVNNPYSNSYSYPDNYHSSLTPALAQTQKKRYCEIVAAYLEAVPAHLRGGITVWGIRDNDSWLINQLFQNRHADWPLLFDNDYGKKPAFYGVGDALAGKPCH